MPVTDLPDLNHVYAKWERKGPQGSPWNGRNSHQQMNTNTNRVIESGKKKWQQKFQGQHLQPLHRKRTREKNRVVVLPMETVQNSVIAQFKTVPTILPEHFIVSRPLMGQCCNCMPNSQKDFQFSEGSKSGVRNILDVRHEMRHDGPVHRQFATLMYSWRTRTNHKFPDLSMAVLANTRLVEVIQQELLADDVRKERAQLEKRAKKILNGMKARIVNALTKFSGWFLHHFLGLLLSSVYVHKGQLKVIKAASERGLPIIYLPLHKSHLDYILVTFILWNYSIKSPHIAAGDNLKIPFFSMLMNGLGAFFIRRKLDKDRSKKDALYRAVLQSYMEELLRHGEPVEFFIEGGRTRTGKALPPKGGLLSVIIDTVNRGLTEDVYIAPVSISYEKIVDGNFNNELMGIPKKKETFWGALQGIWSVLKAHYGSVRVDFAQPFSLREYMQSIQPPSPVDSPDSGASDMSSSPPRAILRTGSNLSLFGSDVISEDQRQLVASLGQHIVYSCVQTTALMSSNLLAFLFLTKHRQGAVLAELIRDYRWLREEIIIRKRDIGFSPDSDIEDVIFYTVGLLGKNLIDVSAGESHLETFFLPSTTIPDVFELSYYGNSVTNVFLLESILVSSVIYLSDINISTLESSGEEEVILMSKEEILEVAEELCKILQYEFIFVPPCSSLEEKLADVLDMLVTTEVLKTEDSNQFDGYQNTYDKQWASRLSAALSWAEDGEEDEDYEDEQLLRVNLDRGDYKERLKFFHRVLAPFFEAYLVTVHHISKIVEEIPEDDFLQTLHQHAKDRVTQGLASCGESASLETLKNAIKSFKDLKIIETYKTSNLVLLDLKDHYNVKDRLTHYLNLLESLRD